MQELPPRLKIELPPEGEFRRKIAARLEELGMSLNELADRSGASYEYIRKIAHGRDALPSKFLLREICRALRLDQAGSEELTALVVAEKLRKLPPEHLYIFDYHEGVKRIAEAWPRLTASQRARLKKKLFEFHRQNSEKRRREALHHSRKNRTL